MKNLFKISKENANYQSPKKIPDYFFQNNTHCVIPTSSRLSPTFEQMLNFPSARKMFMRYLRTDRLQGLFLCLRDLMAVNSSPDNCQFNDRVIDHDIEEAANRILDVLNSNYVENDISVFREKLECELRRYYKEIPNCPCAFVSIYLKYFTESSFDSCSSSRCIKDTKIVHEMLAELFKETHRKRLSSFVALEKCIFHYLQNTLYPDYLKSSMHHHYQLQLLSSGLNSLQLSDFIYSDEYIMIITDFLEMKGLINYLAFLLAVINLPSTVDGECAFNDALAVYSRFLVMDSVNYFELPASITNSVVNQLCEYNETTGSINNKIKTYYIFQCAFRPVYLFLEQYWLPEFFNCPSYQKSIDQLYHAIKVTQLRHRNHSDNIYKPPAPLINDPQLPDDAKSDISTDNNSVQSEPVMSQSLSVDNAAESANQHELWWPIKRLEDRFRSLDRRPMSLGSFDDLGRYQSVTNNGRHSLIQNSTSSEILSTITEMGSDLWSKISVNSANESRTVQLPPDEIARQIINDVHEMTLRNQ